MFYILFIIFIIILLWIFSSESPEEIYNKTSGVYDKSAALALNKIEKMTTKSANDKALAGNIISEAILEGETPIRGPMRRLTTLVANNYIAALPEFNNLDRHYIDDAYYFNRRLLNTADLFPNDDPEIDNIIWNLGGEIKTANIMTSKMIKDQQKNISGDENKAKISYLDAVKTHYDDPQNAHDTNVSREIRHTLDIIENDNSKIPMNIKFDIADIYKFIDNSNLSDQKINKAKYALGQIIDRNENVFAANRNEMDVIRLVWIRSLHPDNSENKLNIQEALLDSLIDIVKDDGVVCPNGRISRICGSLSALDINPAVGNLNTAEQINNYILDQSAKLWKDYLAECKKNELADVALAYETKDGPEENEDLIKFKAGLKARVDKMLLENSADDNIKEKVYIGFDLGEGLRPFP
jgi:hypothetical protein